MTSKAATGRPSKYTQEIGDEICSYVSMGQPMAKMCKEKKNLPNPATVYRWLREHQEFRDNYELAIQDKADYLVDEIMMHADDPELDPAHKKIMVDARKWCSSRFMPKKYGDKQHLDHTSSDGSMSFTERLQRGRERMQELDD